MPAPTITYQPISVLNHCRDRLGYLILADGVLAAVVIRLDDDMHDGLTGQWFMEKGFGVCEGRDGLFPSFDAVLAWITKCASGLSHGEATARSEAARQWGNNAVAMRH